MGDEIEKKAKAKKSTHEVTSRKSLSLTSFAYETQLDTNFLTCILWVIREKTSGQ